MPHGFVEEAELLVHERGNDAWRGRHTRCAGRAHLGELEPELDIVALEDGIVLGGVAPQLRAFRTEFEVQSGKSGIAGLKTHVGGKSPAFLPLGATRCFRG